MKVSQQGNTVILEDIKHFNPKENKNIVERYYNRSVP